MSRSTRSGGRGAVHQPHRAVVPKEQRLGDVTDGRAAVGLGTSNGEQELVLGRCDAERRGLFFAPLQEPADRGPEPEELPVFVVVEVGIEGAAH